MLDLVITRSGQPWARSEQLGAARTLNYTDKWRAARDWAGRGGTGRGDSGKNYWTGAMPQMR